MSKNNKNARLHKEARERSATRQSGSKCGPTKGRATEAKHGKKKAWWQIFRSYSEYISGGGKRAQRGSGSQLQVEADAA